MGTRDETRGVQEQPAAGHANPSLLLQALRRARVHNLDDSFVLFVFPLAPEREGNLTPTELAVAKLAASGLSNRSVAELRGCSAYTIANQLASAYRKLGVSGRRELRARLSERSDVRDR